MSRSSKPKRRWYRWRTRHAHGPSGWHYVWGSRSAVNAIADEHSDGIRGYDVRAIKLPPASWLRSELDMAARAEERARDWHLYIGSLIASPSNPVEPPTVMAEGDIEEWL